MTVSLSKGNIKGTPPEYTSLRVSGEEYKWQDCGTAGCNYEVMLQLIIVMVIKPIFLNIFHFVRPRICLIIQQG